jgi:hypothetical protein
VLLAILRLSPQLGQNGGEIEKSRWEPSQASRMGEDRSRVVFGRRKIPGERSVREIVHFHDVAKVQGEVFTRF